MRTLIRNIATTALFGLLAVNASAVFLSIEPASSTVGVGGTVDVNLNISGLGDFSPESLGAFLVEITFNDLLVSVAGVTYGSLLGDTDPLAFETDIVTTSAAGSISLDLISFLFDFELDALQPSNFTLATLSFMGLAQGTTALGFGAVDLADGAFPASSLPLDGAQAASLTVGTPPQPVPEPAVLLLVLVGLGGWYLRERRR